MKITMLTITYLIFKIHELNRAILRDGLNHYSDTLGKPISNALRDILDIAEEIHAKEIIGQKEKKKK